MLMLFSINLIRIRINLTNFSSRMACFWDEVEGVVVDP